MIKCKPLLVLSVFLLSCCQNTSDKEMKPTVYLVGDSTVKNGQGDGAGGLWGWGDFIGQFLNASKIKVENHALGGTSSRTFQSKGLWPPVKDSLQKGDYVLIQFGHNDAGPINDDFRARGSLKGVGDKTEEIDNILTGEHEIVHSYGWYIRKLIKETKEKGAIPVVMSPIPRNKWENNEVSRNSNSYGGWAKQVAKEEGVTFIDLNDKMATALETKGEDKVTEVYFYKRDHTHTTAKGAALAASLVIEGLKESGVVLKDFTIENPNINLPDKKNIYLIGDSTVANNSDEQAVGWGVPLEKYVDTTRVNIINKARGGRSSRTYWHEGLWVEVKDRLKEGDFVLMQFGHNDGGDVSLPKHRASLKGISDSIQEVSLPDGSTQKVHTYGWYMKKYIRETKEKGATPIVFSHIPRNKWNDERVERNKDTYGKWTKEVAALDHALFIDLNDSIAKEYEKIGSQQVAEFFPKDHTHTNMEGAELNALIIAKSLKQARESEIREYIFMPKE